MLSIGFVCEGDVIGHRRLGFLTIGENVREIFEFFEQTKKFTWKFHTYILLCWWRWSSLDLGFN